jgi:hypothetical protein
MVVVRDSKSSAGVGQNRIAASSFNFCGGVARNGTVEETFNYTQQLKCVICKAKRTHFSETLYNINPPLK